MSASWACSVESLRQARSVSADDRLTGGWRYAVFVQETTNPFRQCVSDRQLGLVVGRGLPGRAHRDDAQHVIHPFYERQLGVFSGSLQRFGILASDLNVVRA